jgi:predicted HAD superfamily hydrolase
MHTFITQLEKVETVTFDIFDTLLHRRVSAPTDVFELVRAFFLDKEIMFDAHDAIVNFPHIRRLAESTARDARINNFGGDPEVTLDEIYEALQELARLDKTSTLEIKKAELYFESLVIYRSLQGKKYYDAAIRHKKRIFYISDMYLSQNYLKGLLEKNGYIVDNLNQIYVSCAHRINKHSGKLFSYFLEENNLPAHSCLHIGDNKIADIRQPKSLGINVHFANWSRVDNTYKPARGHFNDYIAKSIINAINLPQHQQFLPLEKFEKLGYQIWGPLIFGYMLWMVNSLKRNKIDKVLFFARDAHFIMDLYHSFFANNLKDISTEYVYVSRASILNGSFSDWSMHRLYVAFAGKSKRTIEEVFDVLRLDAKNHMDDIRQVGFSGLDDIVTADKYPQMHHLINKLYLEVMENSLKNRAEYQSYFDNVVSDGSKIALIDIGWSGNMQAMFLRLLGDNWINKEFTGLYLGTLQNADANISPYVQMDGWLTSNGEPKYVEDLLINNGGVELLEFSLTSDHGSTLGYKISNNKVIPILEEASNDEEYTNKAISLQSGIKHFFQEHQFLIDNFDMEALISREWAQPFINMVSDPDTSHVKLLASLTHSDTAGKNSKRQALAKEVSKKAKKKKCNEYWDAYKESYWKSAFIKLNSI